jgi:hypothetical protein
MRQRVEDLGRLAVLIKNLLDHKLFDEDCLPRRPKDYWVWFSELSEDRKADVINSWVYGIENLQEKLYEILEIAEGTDRLNETE